MVDIVADEEDLAIAGILEGSNIFHRELSTYNAL